MVDPHRAYLRAELAKLRNDGDARGFLDRGACDLAALDLPNTPAGLARVFVDQAAVDGFVDGLRDSEAVLLTEACGRWRNNGVADALRGRVADLVDVPTGDVYLRCAEPWYACVFERHHFRLVEIASDSDLLAGEPYSDHKPGDEVEMPICIAEPLPGGGYRLFDGMHRAIQLARNGEPTIPLCALRPRRP
jgi:hypothetical protein